MLRFVKRNIGQLEQLIAETQKSVRTISSMALDKITIWLAVAKTIYNQQLLMAQTRGRRIPDRVVSFHQPPLRPMIRGKEKGFVEFGIKAHVALVDGFAFLDHAQFNPFHEGNLLPDRVQIHFNRFGCFPYTVVADQLYATRANRTWMNDRLIIHSFKPIGRPPSIPEKQTKAQRAQRRKLNDSRNAIEGFFCHLKSRFKLNCTTWSVQNGHEFQVWLRLRAFNLTKAANA